MVDKVVQTTVPETTYAKLAHRARSHHLSIKETVRQALDAYLREPLPPADEDPLWAMVGNGDDGADDLSERKDWREAWKS